MARQQLTLDDLIASGHECRYWRTVGAIKLREILNRIDGECTWCGGPLPKGRTSMCSRLCRESFEIRCLCWYKLAIWERDKGVCASCGTSKACIEIDHIVPVIEGGGLCGLDGLRTLCMKCHKVATAELNRKRAQQQRDARRQKSELLF